MLAEETSTAEGATMTIRQWMAGASNDDAAVPPARREPIRATATTGRAGRRAVAIALTWLLLPAGQAHAADGAAPAARPAWGQTADFVDYGLILGGLAMVGAARLFEHPLPARLGPVYDPKQPAAIFAPALADRIGKGYREEGDGELVPVSAATVAVGAVFVAVGIDAVIHQASGGTGGGRTTHDALVGFAEGAALTLGLTEMLKPIVGRLRPDFQDRALRYHCQVAPIDGVDCTGVPRLAATDAEARRLLDDGRKSFPSGHSAASFFAATYAASYLGGRYIWGAEATDTSRSIALLSSGLLLSAAGFIATSRFDDGRHNLTDIVTGAGLGVSFAAFSYWRRFDGAGRSRRAGADGPQLGLVGRGLAVTVGF